MDENTSQEHIEFLLSKATEKGSYYNEVMERYSQVAKDGEILKAYDDIGVLCGSAGAIVVDENNNLLRYMGIWRA